MNESLHFGDYIRRLRNQQGIPLRKIAAELDIDPSTLGKIEKNTRNASQEQIEALSRIFNVPAENLNTLYLSDKLSLELSVYPYSDAILEMTREKIITKKQRP
jgi:HTH-type transcriptional regulator, competence development regulator